MKLFISKLCQGTIDTEPERRRIKKAFRNDPVTRGKLTKLMDAVEQGQWAKAQKMLSSKWWKGRDKRQTCPRLEFVGLLDIRSMSCPPVWSQGFDPMASYADLIWTVETKAETEDVIYQVTPMTA